MTTNQLTIKHNDASKHNETIIHNDAIHEKKQSLLTFTATVRKGLKKCIETVLFFFDNSDYRWEYYNANQVHGTNNFLPYHIHDDEVRFLK